MTLREVVPDCIVGSVYLCMILLGAYFLQGINLLVHEYSSFCRQVFIEAFTSPLFDPFHKFIVHVEDPVQSLVLDTDSL